MVYTVLNFFSKEMIKRMLVLLFALVAVLLVYSVMVIIRVPFFKRELKHINIELERSDREEMIFWKYRKKRLYLFLFFFLRY